MTYAEKADIAAKAVKVLDSVTMSRHKASAKQYAYLARKHLLKCKDEHGSGVFYGFTIKASPAIEQINKAVESMVKRLDKPRYTLKDGEWVRKWPEECRGVGLKAGSGYNHYMMTQKEAKRLRCQQTMAMAQNFAGFGGYDPRPFGNSSQDPFGRLGQA